MKRKQRKHHVPSDDGGFVAITVLDCNTEFTALAVKAGEDVEIYAVLDEGTVVRIMEKGDQLGLAWLRPDDPRVDVLTTVVEVERRMQRPTDADATDAVISRQLRGITLH